MTDNPIQAWQFEKEKVTLKSVYPSAILTIEVTGKGLRKYVTKATIFHIEKNGEITYTTKETEFFTVLAIQAKVKLLRQIINSGRIEKPGASVFEILLAHYGDRAIKEKIRLSP